MSENCFCLYSELFIFSQMEISNVNFFINKVSSREKYLYLNINIYNKFDTHLVFQPIYLFYKVNYFLLILFQK